MGTIKQISVHANHAAARSAPYQLAIENAEFDMTVLEDHVPHTYASDCTLVPPTWFSVTLTAPTRKRYLHLVQKETDTGMVVVIMMFDRCAASGEGGDLRLPQSGAWLRAVVDGAVYVLASDLVLSRKAITAWIGGHEPPPEMPPQPPYT